MADKINVIRLTDFIDTKINEIRKDDALGFVAKVTAYNILIDLMNIITEEQNRKDGAKPTYI